MYFPIFLKTFINSLNPDSFIKCRLQIIKKKTKLELTISECFKKNPFSSTSTAHRVLQKAKYRPYKLKIVQVYKEKRRGTTPEDYNFVIVAINSIIS